MVKYLSNLYVLFKLAAMSNILPRNISQKNFPPRNTLRRNNLPRNILPKNILPKNIPSRNILQTVSQGPRCQWALLPGKLLRRSRDLGPLCFSFLTQPELIRQHVLTKSKYLIYHSYSWKIMLFLFYTPELVENVPTQRKYIIWHLYSWKVVWHNPRVVYCYV